MVADTDSGRSVWFDVEDHAFEHPVDLPSTRVTRVDDGYEVTVTTDVLLRDVVVQADRVAPDAEADAALLTLLPGESEVIRIRTSAHVDPELFTRHPVLTWVGAAGGGAEVPCPEDAPAAAAAGPLAGSPAPAKAS
jgi:beta-mannosidase